MDVKVTAVHDRKAVPPKCLKQTCMGEVSAVLVLADDWAGHNEQLTAMLARNLGKEFFLLLLCEIVEALDCSDDIETVERRPKEISGLEPLHGFIKQENRVVPVHFQFAKKYGRQPEFIERKLPEIAPRPSLPTPVVHSHFAMGVDN